MKKDINIENKYDSIYNESMKYYNYLKKFNNESLLKLCQAEMDKMAYLFSYCLHSISN